MIQKVCRALLQPIVLVTWMLVASPWVIAANDNQWPLKIDHQDFNVRLAQGLRYFEDSSASLSLADIQKLDHELQFKTFEKENLQFGYSQSALWFKIPISNTMAQRLEDADEDRIFVSIRYPLLDSVDVYHVRDDQVFALSAGDQYPYYHRFLKLNAFSFPFALKPGERGEIYVRVQSTSTLTIPLFVQAEKAFLEKQHEIDSWNGVYFGVTIGLCIYNLFLWIGIRKPVYGLYVFAIINLMLFNATLMGFSFRFWPDWVGFQQVSIYLFSVTGGISVCLFGIVFLKTKRFQPRLHKVLVGTVVVFLIAIPFILISTPQVASKINMVVILLGVFLLFAAATRSVFQGFGPAKYYLIGQGAVLFSVFFTALSSRGIIPLYHLAPEVMKWTSAFELIFFSIGLADLINKEKKLREQAQKESTLAQQQLLDAQVKINEDLDLQVKKRTEQLEAANKRLEELNITDDLTGLRNRRYLNQILPVEYLRAYREKTPIAVLMFDIDFFKKLNDEHGHQFGDFCLATAGDIILKNIRRPPDIACRYGGEEFVVLLPNTDSQGALAVAEKIRAQFESTELADGENKVIITVSIGAVSEVPGDRETHRALLKKADTLLYEAKQAGRNCVKALTA